MILAILATTVYRQETEVLAESLEARGRSLTLMFSRFLVDPVLKQDFVQVQQLVAEGRDRHLFQSAAVVDAEGKFLAHTTVSLQGRPMTEAPGLERIVETAKPLVAREARLQAVAGHLERIRAADRRSDLLVQKLELDGHSWMQFSTPIGLERGHDVGAFLLVGLDTAPEIDRVVRATQLRLSKLFLPMLVLGILLSSFLARHIAQPILLAVENVRRIATGDHGHRLAVAGPAELTVLAEGINQMSGEIRQRITEIADANAKLDRKVYELSVLYDVSKAMNFRSYSPELLTYLLDIILDALNASWGSIMMVSEDGEILRTRIVRGASWDPESAVEIPAGTGIAGEVFSSGEPIISNLGHMDARFAAIPGQSKEFERQIRQMICAPLLVDSKPIGVINIVNKKDGSEFNDDDRHLLVALAAQAARSLENARLYAETIREPKTGLFIPNYFAARVSEQIANARRFKEEFCVVMVDIDFFKQVNDTYGHLVGDEILLKVARFIKETLRESIDVACRFGGEEFALLLPHTDRAGGLAYAERLRKRTEAESPEPDRNLPGVTVSLGVATYPQDGGHYTLLVQEADRRLYQSKQDGRNRVTA